MKNKVTLNAEQLDNQSKVEEFVKAIEENKILNAKIRINKALLEDAKAILNLHDSIEGDNLNITMKVTHRKAHWTKASNPRELIINRF